MKVLAPYFKIEKYLESNNAPTLFISKEIQSVWLSFWAFCYIYLSYGNVEVFKTIPAACLHELR